MKSNTTAPQGNSRAAATAAAADGVGTFVDDYLPALLTRASHLISGEFHAIAAAQGYTVSEWRVLASLAGGEPMSVGRLARITVTKQPTLTRVLDRMQDKGKVERTANAGDRRITLVRITASGRATVAKLIALAREHEQRVLEPFGVDRAAKLKATLRRMIELHETEGETEGETDGAPD